MPAWKRNTMLNTPNLKKKRVVKKATKNCTQKPTNVKAVKRVIKSCTKKLKRKRKSLIRVPRKIL